MKEECCGACCYFKHEDTDGWGLCPKLREKTGDIEETHCSDLCTCDGYASEEEKRHHMAVLRKCQRCLKSAENKDLDVENIQKAIDFLVSYCKLY